MRYLHTMLRVSDLDPTMDFFGNKLGLVEVNRMESKRGRFTLVLLAAPNASGREPKRHRWSS